MPAVGFFEKIVVLLMLTFFIFILMVFRGTVNTVTLPWYSISMLGLGVAIVFGLHGRYILARILPRRLCPCVMSAPPIIVDNMIVFPRVASTKAGYVGLMFFRLKPTTPISDLQRDEEKIRFLERMEGFLIGLPYTARYSVVKTTDPVVDKEIRRITRELVVLERRQRRTGSPELERRIKELRAELDRLRRSKAVASIIYMVVYVEANSLHSLRSKARDVRELVEYEATKIMCIAEPLKGFDLQELLEVELLGRLAIE